MATVQAADLDAVVVMPEPPGRPLPARVVTAASSAGFPADVGDPTTLFRYASLDARSPTVSNLLNNNGLTAYTPLGLSIQRAITALNRVENPRWSMRTIGGEFIFLDPQRLASLSPTAQESVRAAFVRMARDLGGATSGTIDSDTDAVEPRRAVSERPGGPPRAALEPPQPASRRATGSQLPAHPALEGISDGYRAWLQRGEHRMETVEALLGQRPETFEAGLTIVQTRYGLGAEGRPANLEEAAQALQTQLGVPGAADGKFGRVSTPFLRNARERYSEATLDTPAGRRATRTALQDKQTLQAAISPQLGADHPPQADVDEPAQIAEPVLAAPQAVVETVLTPVEPVANPYGDLAALRASDPAAYETRRSRILDGAQNDPAAMATMFSGAHAVNRDVASDLATAWLDRHTPSILPDAQLAAARRDFARLVGQDRALVAALPPALNDRLGRILGPMAPSQGLFSAPTADALSALAAFEANRVARATSLDDLVKDDRNRYATFMWASPDVVAATITRLATSTPDAADRFGSDLAKHLQSGGPIATLDGRVDAAYAIFQNLQGATRQRVDDGMRGMGDIFGINIFGIEDRLVDRVTKPRA